MAKSKSKALTKPDVKASTKPAVTEEPSNVDVVDEGPLDPKKFIAVDFGSGSFAPIPLPAEYTDKERTITLEGKTFEHVAEYRGVWAYRHLR